MVDKQVKGNSTNLELIGMKPFSPLLSKPLGFAGTFEFT